MDNENTPFKGQAIGLPVVPLAWMQTTQEIQLAILHGVRSDGSLTGDTIVSLLHIAGSDMAEVGQVFGCTRQYVRDVVTRKRRSVRIENYIAERLSMNADRIWGRLSVEYPERGK